MSSEENVIPAGNVDHFSLKNEEKSTPEKELAEYLIQYRTDDLDDIDRTKSIELDLEEHEILKNVLFETKDEFRIHLRDAIVLAHTTLKYERDQYNEVERISRVLRNKIKILIHAESDVRINELTSTDYEGEVVIFESQISNWSKIRSITHLADYKCPECDYIKSERFKPKLLLKCPQGCRSFMEFFKPLKAEDTRRLTLREITDDYRKKMPFSISADIYGKNVSEIELGDKVMVIGVFRSVPLGGEKGKISQEFIPTIQIISTQNMNTDVLEIPDMELMKKLKDLEDEDKLVSSVIDGFAYNIYKKRFEKKAVICSLLGSKWIGDVGQGNAPMIHILFIGDPETYKSTIMKYTARVSNNVVLADSTTVSNAGIKAIAVKMDDGRFSIMPGLMPMYNGGNVFFDEFGDLKPDIYADLKAPMIDGRVSKHVAGEDFNAIAETGVLAAMNPTDGVYDTSKTIYENMIRIPKPLITRFDLIFRFGIEFNQVNKKEINAHLDQYDKEGKPEQYLTDEEIRLFINYAKTIKPEITPEAFERNTEFFSNIKVSDDNDISIDTRTKNGVMKIAVALAKWHMSNKVTMKHVDEALELYNESLATFNLSLEKGEIINNKSLKKTNDGRRQAIERSYEKIKNEDGYVFEDELIDEAITFGCFDSRGQVKSLVGKLRLEGKCTELNHMLKFDFRIG